MLRKNGHQDINGKKIKNINSKIVGPSFPGKTHLMIKKPKGIPKTVVFNIKKSTEQNLDGFSTEEE